MLRSKEQLRLTSEQVRSLKTLRDGFQRGAVTRGAQIQLAVLDLRGLREQEPFDLPKVEAQVRRIALLRADQHIAHIKLIHDSKAVLTPDQQERWKQLAHASRMEHRGMGMMEPGMRPVPPTE
jgi:Spy/CpxP family protein refolding chaperone